MDACGKVCDTAKINFSGKPATGPYTIPGTTGRVSLHFFLL